MGVEHQPGLPAFLTCCRRACVASLLAICPQPSVLALPGAAGDGLADIHVGAARPHAAGLHAFPWPAGSRYLQILHGTRWQGCALDAAVFESGLDPVVLARQVAASLAQRPGIMAAVSPLVLDWHDGGRHWIMRIGAGVDGGAQGSVSAWSLADCSPERFADLQAPRQAQRLLDWQDAVAGRQVRQSVYLHATQDVALVQARWRAALLRQGWRMGRHDGPRVSGAFPGAALADDALVGAGLASQGPGPAIPAAQYWTRPGWRLRIALHPHEQGWIVHLHQEAGGATGETVP